VSGQVIGTTDSGAPNPTTARSARPAATVVGVAAFGVYVAWNVYWLAQQKIPPSLFKALTGLPCPTTGGTRSALALYHGDFAASLRFNPMLLPISALLAMTIALAIARRGRAPGWLARAWIVLLGVAWLIKLVGPRDAW